MQRKRAEIDAGVRSRDDDVRTLSKDALNGRQHDEGWRTIDGECGNALCTGKRYLRNGKNLPVLDLADGGATSAVRFKGRRHLDVMAVPSKATCQAGQRRCPNSLVVGNQDTQSATLGWETAFGTGMKELNGRACSGNRS